MFERRSTVHQLRSEDESGGTSGSGKSKIKQLVQSNAGHSDDDDEGHGGGGGGHESDEFLWLFSFNDMLFNLLLFFIVMFAISSVNKSKFEAVAEALNYPKGESSGTSDQPLFFEKENISTSLKEVSSRDVYVECSNPLTPPMGPGVGKFEQGTSEFAGAQAKQQAAEFESKVIVLSGSQYFRKSESEPTPKGLRLVKKLAKIYRNNDQLVQVQIEGYGYLDEFPARKLNLKAQTPRVRAWGLSAQRAASVLSLMSEEGFNENIISIVGVGPGSKEHKSVNTGGKHEKQKRPKVIIRLTESKVAKNSQKPRSGKKGDGKKKQGKIKK